MSVSKTLLRVVRRFFPTSWHASRPRESRSAVQRSGVYPLMSDVHPPILGIMSYMTTCRPLFLAGLVFTVTLADHAPWDHHTPHEQAAEPVVVHAAPITSPTSGAFFFSTFSSTVVASGFPPLVFRA